MSCLSRAESRELGPWFYKVYTVVGLMLEDWPRPASEQRHHLGLGTEDPRLGEDSPCCWVSGEAAERRLAPRGLSRALAGTVQDLNSTLNMRVCFVITGWRKVTGGLVWLDPETAADVRQLRLGAGA